MDDKKKTEEVEPEDQSVENEGEGSKSADRQYRKDVDDFLQENDPSKLARQAQREVERDPKSYEEAEREGKRRSAGDLPIDKEVI
jgi:hypothetical protein